jgi:PTH1 family peptidyl-tRNA hydrolase
LADYVLGHFTPAENKEVNEACKKAVDAVTLLIQEKTDEAMNKYN